MKSFTRKALIRFFIPAVIVISILTQALPSLAAKLGVMYFTPQFVYLKDWLGRNNGGELNVKVAVIDPGVGSASVETNNPFMYFDVYNWPTANYDFPCGIGTPEELAGLSAATGARTLTFQRRAACREGEGYYLGTYEARVTDRNGVHPASGSFQPMGSVQALVDN